MGEIEKFEGAPFIFDGLTKSVTAYQGYDLGHMTTNQLIWIINHLHAEVVIQREIADALRKHLSSVRNHRDELEAKNILLGDEIRNLKVELASAKAARELLMQDGPTDSKKKRLGKKTA